MTKSLAYLAGVGASALDYDGPCPFSPEDIGYNDYADGFRDGSPSTTLDGETIEEISEDRDDIKRRLDNEEDNNATLRGAIDEAIGILADDRLTLKDAVEKASNELENALK